jgi:YbbR domain-containing protein
LTLPNFIAEEWARKLSACICAGLIWYSVHKQIQEEEIFRDIPVNIKLPQGMIIHQRELPKIDVKLRGPKRRLKALSNTEIKIIVRISDDISGSYTVSLKDKNVIIPDRSLEVVEIEPRSIPVYVDKVLTSDGIPIRCRFIGELPEGYGRKSFFTVPKTAQITGPSKVVQEIREIVTESIELDQNIREDFEVDIPLLKIPQATISPETVKVTVELYKMKESKFFENLGVSVMNSKDTDFHVAEYVNPAEPNIEAVLSGPKATIDILTSSSLTPFINISDITASGTYRLPVHLWVDAQDCSALEIKPLILEVEINRLPRSD